MLTSIYNQLPCVEDADKDLKRKIDFEGLLAATSAIAKEHELGAHLGLFLLHRHFELGRDEKMCERMFIDENDRPALASIPTQPSADDNSLPASWMFRDGEMHSFEFSSDPLVLELSQKLEADIALKNALRDAIHSFNAIDLIGFGVVTRDSLSEEAFELWLEEIDEDGRRQVVRSYHADEKSTDGLLRTRWALDETRQFFCKAMCLPRCIPYSPGHSVSHSTFHGIET